MLQYIRTSLNYIEIYGTELSSFHLDIEREKLASVNKTTYSLWLHENDSTPRISKTKMGIELAYWFKVQCQRKLTFISLSCFFPRFLSRTSYKSQSNQYKFIWE